MARALSFRSRLESAIELAIDDLKEQVGSERVYAFGLYTSGEDGFSYVTVSANTEEALARAAESSVARRPGRTVEEARAALRWSACDWEWHDFSKAVGSLTLLEGEGGARDRRLYTTFTSVLGSLDARGAFKIRKRRPTLAILCGDMSTGFLERSIKALNPQAVFEKFRREHTPGPYLDRLARLPKSKRLETLLGLYRELALDLPTPRAIEAKRRNVDHRVLEPAIASMGPSVTPRLIDLIDEYGFGPPFNEKGSEAWKKSGAATSASRLSTSAVRLAQKAGLSEIEVNRIQTLIARRTEIDSRGNGAKSALAACLAKVLHETVPNRFPSPERDPRTNRLQNAAAFL